MTAEFELGRGIHKASIDGAQVRHQMETLLLDT